MNERKKSSETDFKRIVHLFVYTTVLCVGLCDVFLFSPLDTTEMLMDLLNPTQLYTVEEEVEQFGGEGGGFFLWVENG